MGYCYSNGDYDALAFPFDNQDDAVTGAQKLLSDAGYPNGPGFPTISILSNTNEAHKQIAEFIKQEWKNNLAINVRFENQEWQTYLSNRNQGTFIVAFPAGTEEEYLPIVCYKLDLQK